MFKSQTGWSALNGVHSRAGIMGEAILNHDFSYGKKQGIKYLVIADRTFSKFSEIAGNLVSSIVKPIFYITGTEDGISAAEKLSQLGIQKIVIQHKSQDALGSDKVTPDKVSLAHEIHQVEPYWAFGSNKIFLESDQIDHNDPLPRSIQRELNFEINQFFQNNKFLNWMKYFGS